MCMKKTTETLNKLKREIIEVSSSSKEGHVASAFSILDILWVLYDKILKIRPKNTQSPDRDFFILSKGHASLGQYAVLKEKGFIDKDTFKSFGKYESVLGGHPKRNTAIGIESSTGSLGHGMPMAVGIAMGLKIQNKEQKVFTLIGDGEMNEGTIWESIMLASHHKLDNFCCIADYNHSTDRALALGNIEKKFKAFDFKTVSINGHDHTEIEKALKTNHPNQPLAIIAKTIKGHGIKVMENNPEWHHKSPSLEQVETFTEELS
jgi:transketolase